MANDAGSSAWLGRLNAQARRIVDQIRAGGFEPEPAEVARRVTEEQERRAARSRLAERGRIVAASSTATRAEQRARVLGIRRSAGSSKRAGYNRAVGLYAMEHEMTYHQVRRDRTFQYWYRILREQENRLLAGKYVSRDPRGLYALALRKLGYKHESVNPVGHSDTYEL
jgi:hypothetical protein